MKKRAFFFISLLLSLAIISFSGADDTRPPYVFNFPQSPNSGETINFSIENNQNADLEIIQFIVNPASDSQSNGTVYGSGPIRSDNGENLKVAPGETATVYQWNQAGNTQSYNGQVEPGDYTAVILYKLSGDESSKRIGKSFTILDQPTIKSTCKTFTCEPWTACNNNIKTRVCKSAFYYGNGCTDVPEKPSEFQFCDIMASNLSCKDSDTPEEYSPNGIYGDEPYLKGHLIDENQNADYWDTCIDLQTTDTSQPWTPTAQGKIVMEYYCNGNNYQYKAVSCDLGCKDGTCINPCVDTDNGNDFFIKGKTYINYSGNNQIPDESKFTTDFCENDYQLREYDCKIGSIGSKSEVYTCPFGCKDGACIKIKPESNDKPANISDKINSIKNESVKDEIKKENYSTICDGCVIEKSCYPFGFRKNGEYCLDTTKAFEIQKSSDSICNNNFECSSNLCIDSKCLSSGVWQRILRWFSGIFGGK